MVLSLQERKMDFLRADLVFLDGEERAFDLYQIGSSLVGYDARTQAYYVLGVNRAQRRLEAYDRLMN